MKTIFDHSPAHVLLATAATAATLATPKWWAATMCSLSIGVAALVPSAHAADKPALSAAMQKTGTQFKADADMQAVLDELASLNGKPSKA